MKRQGGFALAEAIVAMALMAVLAAAVGLTLGAAARVTRRLQEARRLETLAGLLLDDIEEELAGCRPQGDGTAAQSVAIGAAGDTVSFLDAWGRPVTIALTEGKICHTCGTPETGQTSRQQPEEVYQGSRVAALAFAPAQGRAGQAQLIRVELTVAGPEGGTCTQTRLAACYDLGRAVPWADQPSAADPGDIPAP